MLTRAVLAGLVAIGAASVSAAELAVMSAGAVEPGLLVLVDQFMKTSGHSVRIEYATGPQLAERLAAGRTADVLIAPAAVVDRAIADRRVDAGTRVTVGRVGVGVVVRRDAPTPDVPSVDALRRAVLAADGVVYNQGSSGVYVDGMLNRLGVMDAIRTKTVRVSNGDATMQRLVTGSGNEIGFAAISEIKLAEPKGVRLVAPLPDAVQNFTTLDAVVMAGAHEPGAAAEFVRFMTTTAARQTFAAVGVQ